MAHVETVRGPLPPTELGNTYPHEHILTNPPTWRAQEDPDYVLPSEEKIVRELEVFSAAGGRTIVDATSIDYGRDVERLVKVQAQVEPTLVCITGFNRGDFAQDWVVESSREELRDLVVRERLNGIDGTGVKPGAVKLGTSYNHIMPVEDRFIFAAAQANRQTGIPILTHTTRGTLALEQLDLLDTYGGDLSRVAISHIDQNLDLFVHRKVVQRGAYLLYDGWSKIKYHSDSARIAILNVLLDEGYEDRLLISGDMGRQTYLTAYGGGPGFGFLLTKLRQRLLEEGWGAAILTKIFVTNPARWLGGES
jgi:predicted metal-dependent phosphotriesterase family hydrolase